MKLLLAALSTLHIRLMTATMRKYFGMLIPNKNFSPKGCSHYTSVCINKKIRNILNEHHQQKMNEKITLFSYN